MERIGIVAVAQTPYKECEEELHQAEKVYLMLKDLFERTGLSYKDIDAVVVPVQDLFEGKAFASSVIGDVVGHHHRPGHKIDNDGAFGVLYGSLQILSGHYDTVMVVACCYDTLTNPRIIENLGVDKFFERELGLEFLSCAALQANLYMKRFGIAEEQCARVVVKNRRNAVHNPYASSPWPDIDVKDILNSEMIAYPIKALDVKPPSDGACVVILAREEKAKKLTDKPIWIKGMGSCCDSFYLGDRDLTDPRSLRLAAERAYRMAGITDPARELDVVEVSEFYSYQELLWYEGLGLCERGEGGKLIESGRTQRDGRTPVNPSGGLLAGVPFTVAGLSRVAECVLQLRGEAGDRQVEGARIALAHGTDGRSGQAHCVIILGRD